MPLSLRSDLRAFKDILLAVKQRIYYLSYLFITQLLKCSFLIKIPLTSKIFFCLFTFPSFLGLTSSYPSLLLSVAFSCCCSQWRLCEIHIIEIDPGEAWMFFFFGLYLLTAIITPTLALLFHFAEVKTTVFSQRDHFVNILFWGNTFLQCWPMEGGLFLWLLSLKVRIGKLRCTEEREHCLIVEPLEKREMFPGKLSLKTERTFVSMNMAAIYLF